ncbi:MAG: DUF2585 family protein [Anaerolineales bacterium]|nr:DUF2585 family protein [Anaerolineales bacterium]
MFSRSFISNQKKWWPWLATIAILVLAALQLRSQGRLWMCDCGYIWLWSGDVWSSDNSQHWFDPYSFSHMLHGFIFFWLLAWGLPRLAVSWQLCLALFVEALWEIFENSAFVINRYREATAALGYQGDTVINSLGDIIACGIGFAIAWRLGFRRSLALFVITELVLLFWIRDNLTLNIIMLLYPIEAIKAWQIGP